jgi:hypothetical protein
MRASSDGEQRERATKANSGAVDELSVRQTARQIYHFPFARQDDFCVAPQRRVVARIARQNFVVSLRVLCYISRIG